MDLATQKQLIALNHHFYETVADEFDRTRQHPWEGWLNVLPAIQAFCASRQRVEILDVGCGNGRFASFLAQHLSPDVMSYTGVDTSPALLAEAKARCQREAITATFAQLDVATELIGDKLNIKLDDKWDIILLIAVLHHIPSHELRLQLLTDLRKLLKPNGLLLVTTWNFIKSESVAKKIVDPTLAKLDPAQLETHDYILGWSNHDSAFRYCHFFESDEVKELFAQAGLEVVDFFYSDGRTRQLNTYYLLARKGYNERHES